MSISIHGVLFFLLTFCIVYLYLKDLQHKVYHNTFVQCSAQWQALSA